jgi:hypothetical protein
MLRNLPSCPLLVFPALLWVCLAWPIEAQEVPYRDGLPGDFASPIVISANQDPAKPSASDFMPVLGKWCDSDSSVEFKTVDAYHLRVDYPNGDWFKPTARALPPDPLKPGSKSFLLDFGIRGTMRLDLNTSGGLDSLGPGKGPQDSPRHTLHKC